MSYDPNSTATMGLVSEGVIPDLSDLAEEPSQGAWPNGWYSAQIVEGYSTRKGTQFQTEDILAKNGESRNLRLCFVVTNAKGETRNIQEQYNYRPEDFTPERISAVKEARAEFKGVQGKWPGGAADLQRSSLALAKIGAIQKAIGFSLKSTEVGLDASIFTGQSIDVRLTVDEKGYNQIKEVAKAGTKVSSKR